MVVVGAPGGTSGARLDLLLAHLARDSRAAAQRVTTPSIVPPLLHQVLARLVTGPLAGEDGAEAALVVFDDGHDVALGWAGRFEHLIVGEDTGPSWIRLRDGSGREAHACVFPIQASAEMVFSWPVGSTDPNSPSVLIDVARGPADAWHGWSDDPAEAQAALERMIAARFGGEPPAIPDEIPPTPEPEWLTRAAMGDSVRAIVAPPVEESRARASDVVQAEEQVARVAEAPPSEEVPGWSAGDFNAAPGWSAPDSGGVDAGSNARAQIPAGEVEPASNYVLVQPAKAIPPPAPAAGDSGSWRAPAIPMRPAWPSARELAARPLWRRPWAWAAVATLVLAVAGWLTLRPQPARAPSPFAGFGGRVQFTIDSTPGSAEIVVDGRETGQRTPATLALAPGDHRVTLRLPGLGSADYEVRAVSGERGNIMAILSGTVRVVSTDARVPVTVTLDGTEHGYAPVTIDEVSPGPHELRFRAPGLEPWTETFQLGIGEEREIMTQPFQVPANGVLVVRATRAGDPEGEPIQGASVYVDGEFRGRTPFELELPRGPHSIRVSHAGDEPAVQVIDLPGGNQRFADFVLGAGAEAPRLTRISPTGPMSRDLPTILAVALSGMTESDIREMWLHVRTPEGIWRRFPMELRRASGALLGSTVFPIALIDEQGYATYYVSAMTPVGDEFFTELFGARRIVRAKPAPEKTAEESEPDTP